MALAEMCKARIAVHKTAADELAGKLQSLGCCEFTSKAGEALDGASTVALRSKQRHIEELLSDAKFVERLLEPFEQNKSSSIARALGKVPQISYKDLAARVDEEKFTAFTAKLREEEKDITECRAELSRLKALQAQAEALLKIKYPLEFFTSGTDMVSGAIYNVPAASANDFASRVATELGELAEFQKIDVQGKEAVSVFAVLFRSKDTEKMQAISSDLSAVKIDVPKEFKLTAAEEKDKLVASINALEEKDKTLSAVMVSHADEGLEMARYDSDFWLIIRDRLDSMLSGEPTDNVLIWSFWLPKSRLKSVEDVIKGYESVADFALIEPDEDETPPTLLKNPAWSSSLEPLTLMYGTPTFGAVDPTSLMAPFFFLFMGMCFGDAGYGLLLTALFGYYLVKYQLSPTLRKFFIMLTIGMVCTTVFGVITGSFFGDGITAFKFLAPVVPVAKKLQLLDPMNDPMTLLLISLGLGFIQVIFGLCIAFYINVKNGDKFAAFADQGGWILFLAGLLCVGLSMTGTIPDSYSLISKITAFAGAGILVCTQGRSKTSIFGKIFSGVMSLYNVTGYLGDVLSYSRLLALGLGSAAVGLVINLLCNLVSGVPYIGIVLAALIFTIGHVFSIAVNLLGAFIHPLRLQYVEFFGKFYDANGHDFKPLCNSTQFAKLTE